MSDEEKAPAKGKSTAAPEAKETVQALAAKLGQSPVAVAMACALNGWDGASLVSTDDFLGACNGALSLTVC